MIGAVGHASRDHTLRDDDFDVGVTPVQGEFGRNDL
jgi:hypothetical protein